MRLILPNPAANVNVCVPSTVLESVMFPAPVPVLSVIAPVRVMALKKEMSPFTVVNVP